VQGSRTREKETLRRGKRKRTANGEVSEVAGAEEAVETAVASVLAAEVDSPTPRLGK